MAVHGEPRVASENFTVAVHDSDGLTLIELGGELDVSAAVTLRDALVAADLDEGVDVRMDMTGLQFLDSSGIGFVVGTCKRVRASGGTFSVRCDPGQVRRAIEVTGLVEYLQLDEGAG